MIVRTLFLFVTLISAQISVGQTLRQFTHEPQKFYDELNEIMSTADKKDAKELMDDKFQSFWLLGSAYSDAQKEQIYSVADGMLKKRLRPFPFFKSFVISLMSFPGSPQEGDGFNVWVETLESLLKGSTKPAEEFLEMSKSLFLNNAFYSSPASTWKVNNSNWRFAFDGKNPSIIFPDVNLICVAKGDSAVIYATSGVYDPKTEKFAGKEGKITWERAGLDPNETYAVIQYPYVLNVRSSGFQIDSVLFYNSFFKNPLEGDMEEKILANVTKEKATFPQFQSHAKRLSINNIVDKVDYNGGFRMEGANLQGYGTRQEPATLTFKRENRPQLISYAQFYAIKPDRIASSDARVVILLNNDSIVHPSLQLRFKNKERQLSLIRTDEGLSKSPYYDSYHKIDMYFESFTWNIDDPVIRMGNLFGSTETRAAFESSNFFKSVRYTSLAGMDRINPLYGIREYARKINSDSFDATGVAAHMGYRLELYIPVLIDLANKGFLDYDISSQSITVRSKLYDYISAAAGKIDYDVILFNSDVKQGDNAELNLLNFDLVLKGVDQILLSDSQNVVIYPKNGEVNLRKNRDFNFGGIIRSGKFEFYGEEYTFTYDKFQIDLIAVDSCRLYVEDFSPNSKALRRVKNVIEGIKGTLQIDNPFNKSGLQEEFTEYPILASERESFVYYDNSKIQKGIYERDKVYFELKPFVLDSLDNFATEQVAFDGTFVSGGIFPTLTEKLKIQEDYALGFKRSTPEGGLPLYGNKAVFKNDIILNYSGLQGDGDLEYLTAVASSDQFTFFPDSTKGVTTAFVNAEQVGKPEIPEANATEVGLSFYPIDNKLTAVVTKSPINMFNGQAKAQAGKLDLQPTGLTGAGIVEFSGAELESGLITYNKNSFASDTSSFRLLALQEANLAFKTDNVNAFIDFDVRIGNFKSNGEETKVEFPVNDYICFMDQFKWFMDKNDIALETSREMATDFVIDTELDMNRSNFFSTAKDQDSLNFMSPKAIYDLDNYTITADQIPWIRVADAKITPDSGRVIIRRKAKMDPLENATVLANYITQYHTLTDASISILSRLDYVGSGNYTYVDKDKLPNIIRLDNISVDSSRQTIATGRIPESQRFFLSPQFEYQGKTTMRANEQFLVFDGSTRIIHACDRLERNWMKFTGNINPEEVLIPVDTNLVDVLAKKVDVGMNMAKDPFEMYGTFLSQSRDESDQRVIWSRGVLKYNDTEQKYEVAALQKLNQQNLPGNYISLNTEKCELSALGKMDLATNLSQFDLQTIGKLTFNPKDEKIVIQTSMTMNFPFSDPAMDKMQAYLGSLPDLKGVDLAKSNYEYAMREIMGLAASDKVIAELNLSGTIKKLPEELNKTLFFSDVKLTWDPVLESYISEGELSVASIGKTQFFRKVPGKMVIEKKVSGDIVHVYFEADESNWYYFTYKRGLMQAFASDKNFNNILLEEKEEKRKTAGAKKEDDYTYMLGSKSKQNVFLDQFMF